jgi:hypothetical protein
MMMDIQPAQPQPKYASLKQAGEALDELISRYKNTHDKQKKTRRLMRDKFA